MADAPDSSFQVDADCLGAYVTGVRVGQIHQLRRIWEQDAKPPSRLSAFLGTFNVELLTPSISTLASEFFDEAARMKANDSMGEIAEHLSDIRVHEERLRKIGAECGNTNLSIHDSSFRESVLALRRAINDLERTIRFSLPNTQSAVDNSQLWFELGLHMPNAKPERLDDFDDVDRDELRRHPTCDGEVVCLWEKPFVVSELQAKLGVPYEMLLPSSGDGLQNEPFVFAAFKSVEAHLPLVFWRRIERGIEGLGKSVSHDAKKGKGPCCEQDVCSDTPQYGDVAQQARLTISLHPPQAEFNGRPYSLDMEEAVMLNALLDAHPRAINWREIVDKAPDLLENSRPKRVIGKLRKKWPALAAVIRTQPGKGTWLEFDDKPD